VQLRPDSSFSPFGLPDTPTELERRGEPRISCHKRIQIVPCAGLREGKAVDAELTDVAGSGIGFIVDHPMQSGEPFVIRLQFPDGGRLLMYNVRHMRWLAYKRYAIGAEFSGFVVSPSRLDGGAILGALLALEG
jgi:hypothetical protein